MRTLNIGLVGSGFMGKAHTIAYRALPGVFPRPVRLQLELLADQGEARAREAAERLGFARWTGDWRALVSDPAVDVVDICAPNHLHREMALAAIAAGKAVYCEKPLALSAADAAEMVDAAERAGVTTLVGFNYACNPAAALVREIVAGGEIGEPLHFRGAHNEDYLADPQTPFNWRCERALAGSGALGDIGAHILHAALGVMGPVAELCADLRTVIPERPVAGDPGRRRAVENEDQASALLRFASGATGSIETSRVAAGRKLGLAYEITGSRGCVRFDQERMSEIQLYLADGPPSRRGFRTVLLGPEHPDYAAFSPAPGHGLGFNDMKIVEARDLVDAVLDGAPVANDFRGAWAVNRLIEAMERSHAARGWVAP
ncbi:Gfo/Idh/MocA family protein [Spiribacter halobius]|uniref:Myo-inositol 2-dehydrogenase n=1 Tax=Sediminicurvatus halobius TaxID=2182432 RepID=A0A2U2N6X0_9GAMM|nr:Gfo/Idh/MocA family oxidoreductase [Spiribacter halobius]PWG64955.1 myo-inositol 2-dehydrogenase [Spiribacter halobius]UEX78188.1 Gfo/Idh/MocA family oxidoreductase [Spiribacter halobius]